MTQPSGRRSTSSFNGPAPDRARFAITTATTSTTKNAADQGEEHAAGADPVAPGRQLDLHLRRRGQLLLDRGDQLTQVGIPSRHTMLRDRGCPVEYSRRRSLGVTGPRLSLPSV
jgi:hypothetical protein